MINYESNRSDIIDYLYNQRDFNLNFPTHLHNSYELLVCVDGNIIVNIEDNSYTLNKGECCLILPMQLHSYYSKKYSDTAITIFSYTYIRDFAEKHYGQYATNPVFSMPDIIDLLPSLNLNNNAYSLRSILYKIIGEFASNTKFVKYDNKKQYIVRQIVEYITDNFCNNITLLDMATALGYSYNYTSNMIYSIFKTNFSGIINKYRIDHAKKLVVGSNASLTEIAGSCGYSCTRSFNRNYLKYAGTSPSNERRNNR